MPELCPSMLASGAEPQICTAARDGRGRGQSCKNRTCSSQERTASSRREGSGLSRTTRGSTEQPFWPQRAMGGDGFARRGSTRGTGMAIAERHLA